MKHYKFWILLVLNMLLVLSLSQADLVGDEQGRFISIDYLHYIPQELLNQTNLTLNTTTRNTFQEPESAAPFNGRIGAYIPQEASSQGNPLRGSLIGPEQGYYGYYVLLNNDTTDTNLTYTIKLVDQNSAPIKVGEPIRLQQRLEITSLSDTTQLHHINLWNHINNIDELAVQGSRSVSVYVNDAFQSEQPIFELLLEPSQTKTIFIEYIHEPVKQDITCQDQELVDLLPPGAVIQHTDVSLETILSSFCTVTITHDYANAIIVPIEVDVSDYAYLEGLTGTQSSSQRSVHVQELAFEIEP